MSINPASQKSRIPSMDFRGNKFVNEDGTLTDTAQQFFDLLNKCLQKILGNEGLVAPSQSTSNITKIQSHHEISPTGNVTNTCGFGTIIFDETTNEAKFAISTTTPAAGGTPVFKKITLT